MDQPIDVADCLQRWRRGDERAAEELIVHLHPVLARIVHTHLPRRDAPEDLIQEILMKIFSRLHQYKADAPLAHWASRLAVTTCLDRLRAQKIRPEIRVADLSVAEADVFERATLQNHTKDAGEAIAARDLVDKLLATLPAEERSLIRMVDMEGRSIEEISELTGWGLSKIKMRLFRSRGHIRQQMRYLEEGK